MAEQYRARPHGARPAQNRKPQGSRPVQKSRSTTLSPEEKRRREKARRERLEREKQERARQAALRRRRRKTLFRTSFALALVFVVLYWVWVALSIHFRADGSEDALPLLLFTQGEREEDERFEAEEVCVGGVKYLPVTELENYMAISQFGDHLTRSFLICSNGQYATFYLGTEEAVINGARVSMKAPAFLKEDVLYLPLDFYADKMSCFEYGENNTTYGADVLTYLPEEMASFVFSPDQPCAVVDYGTVPVVPVAPTTPVA